MYNIMAACDPGTTEPYESWEALDDPSILSTQIKKMQLASATKNENNSNVVILPPGLQLSYNHHQQMTIPQQPTVKILKRPQKDNTTNENADKPKVQVKSLEQRKQEYAEARLRIMGEEREEDLNADDEGASSSGSMKFEVLRQPIVRVAVEDNVIRQPRGPDNTKGFNHRS
ncbi:SUZ domain-containing protein 1-like isoform X1 [Melanaphis sacchari]|uniref:SUZ RNA-binding domain-containing n=2 Tax=Melanaphis sacchari TaxID=742174 RepID=A0A2H8TSQ8_9HEMI|nr:SUZ domain-containing protein 1-like isoform X1 [Melanaphis sacchari]